MTVPERPYSWYIVSIIALVVLMPLFSIPALVNASKVDDLWDEGKAAPATQKAEAAKRWLIIGATVSLIIYIIYFVAVALAWSR